MPGHRPNIRRHERAQPLEVVRRAVREECRLRGAVLTVEEARALIRSLGLIPGRQMLEVALAAADAWNERRAA